MAKRKKTTRKKSARKKSTRSKSAKKKATKKTAKKKISKKASRKKTTKKATRRKVAKKATATGIGRSVGRKTRKATKVVRKALTANYYEKELLTWLNTVPTNRSKLAFALILEGSLEITDIRGKDLSQIDEIISRKVDPIPMEEKLDLLNRIDSFIGLVSQGEFDPCKMFRLCDLVDIKNHMNRIDTNVVKILKYAEPFDEILKKVYENKTISAQIAAWFNKDTLVAAAKADPTLLYMFIAFMMAIKGIWDLCECGKKKGKK